MKSAFTTDARPNLVIIDEIDGAAAAGNEHSLIRFLISLATSVGGKKSSSVKEDDAEADEDVIEEEQSVKTTKKSKTKKAPLIRPIICICNDLYVPALRPLRQIAHIIQIRPLSPTSLAQRLRAVCDLEGMKLNTRSLVDLAEAMDSDIRSTLNALQFLHAKQEGTADGENFAKRLTFGAFKDTAKSPLKIYEQVFLNSSNQSGFKSATANSGRSYSQLISEAWSSGLEVERILTGCFELYQDAKFFDNYAMDRVNAALECFSGHDLLANPRHLQPGMNGDGRMEGYCMYALAGLKELFGSPVPNPSIQYKFPKRDYEVILTEGGRNEISFVFFRIL